MTKDEPLDLIADRLEEIRHVSLLTQSMIDSLQPVDERTYRAGLMGANEAGLFRLERQ